MTSPLNQFQSVQEDFYLLQKMYNPHNPAHNTYLRNLKTRIQNIVDIALTQTNLNIYAVLDCQEQIDTFIATVSPKLNVEKKIDIPIQDIDVLDRFYNQIPFAAQMGCKEGLLTRSDIDGGEPFIFMGLISAALFMVIKESHEQGISEGIIMLNGKCVNEENSPNDFKQFFRGLNQMRTMLAPYWDKKTEIKLLLHMFFTNENTTESEEKLKQQLTKETCDNIAAIAACAQRMATPISQRDRFKGEMGSNSIFIAAAALCESSD